MARAAGSNMLLERKRHERSEAADARRDSRELKRAARLVANELAHSAAVIETAAQDGRWDTADNSELKVTLGLS